MSFKFNFTSSDTEDDVNVEEGESEEALSSGNAVPAREILLSEGKVFDDAKFEVLECPGGLQLWHQDSQKVEESVCGDKNLQTSPVVAAVQAHSDLQSGHYEGGLKVWECGIDLVRFLCEHQVQFQGKTVLELGCGAGLPGLLAVQSGASAVHFQDYNEEVIQYLTIPNVQKAASKECQVRFFSGDWSDLPALVTANGSSVRYDYILTAETIYNVKNYWKLHKIFTSLLSDKGIIYVAAKVCYFGVGGSTQDFLNFVEKQNVFQCQICHTIEAGIQRLVLELRRKED